MRLDDDGVRMIFSAKPGGTAYRLGDSDPLADPEHLRLWADTLTRKTEGGVTFWRSTGHPVQYADGSPDGTSHRLMILAGGGTQTCNWKTGALERGFCGSARDLSAFEATVYCRLHVVTGTHESVSWIIRGGWHDAEDPENASCIGLSIRDYPSIRSAFKELTHPTYGYADVRPEFSYRKISGEWVGVKVISYIFSSNQVRNLMYLDTDPYDAGGRKKNDWRCYIEWFDIQGVVMGPYTQAALWAGWMNMFRVDGWALVDFSVLSAREIEIDRGRE